MANGQQKALQNVKPLLVGHRLWLMMIIGKLFTVVN